MLRSPYAAGLIPVSESVGCHGCRSLINMQRVLMLPAGRPALALACASDHNRVAPSEAASAYKVPHWLAPFVVRAGVRLPSKVRLTSGLIYFNIIILNHEHLIGFGLFVL